MLNRIPNENDLARAYFELADIGARCVGAKRKWPYPKMDKYKLLALTAELSRYDPRLFGILVEYFVNNWMNLNPTKVRKNYDLMETPQIFAVISEFLKNVNPDTEVVSYSNYLSAGMKPVPMQFFFHGIYRLGGVLASRAVESSLVEYKRWGFLACERPVIDIAPTKSIGTLDPTSRLNILKRLLEKRKSININDYLKALGNTISRQQAVLDLKNSKFAEKVGRGRGTRWKLAA